MSFAVVDLDREGVSAVLMLLDEQAEAQRIAIEMRGREVSADVIQVDRASLAQLERSGR
jgi:hypothetical protein